MTVNVIEMQARGMTFRVRTAGESGEPVILLHGFPETSAMWLPVLESLADAGYRCLAPDQRGYSAGARPEGKEHYRYIDIAGDVVALADAAGFTKFHLVGHDWGALAGWAVVSKWPERVQSWSALAVPHARAFGEAIRNDPDQKGRSWYVDWFQETGVAEAALSANDFEQLRGIWAAAGPEEVAEYLSVFRQPGALTAAINWYRGSRGIDPNDPEMAFGPVSTPTLTIWGNQDTAIGRQSNLNAAALHTGPYRWVELDCDHWMVQRQPEVVTNLVLGHLRANRMA